ncbi:hypothetical protein BDP55DRAFT_741120 [Colletotrichum godetiae]|uniref:Uncharacterized protein n=1 Tax=Colletotrichum godetiae TaxID=1209918 RepID=A0AAJ0ETX7_9PEZI|nr:uncharacterized protein BDP55DRAFT_741120 [Colletotrichum godetiae]KAK1676686.1 hypothetical protein BDP55DRAFT_741120 [Colletotrichum godetiae]
MCWAFYAAQGCVNPFDIVSNCAATNKYLWSCSRGHPLLPYLAHRFPSLMDITSHVQPQASAPPTLSFQGCPPGLPLYVGAPLDLFNSSWRNGIARRFFDEERPLTARDAFAGFEIIFHFYGLGTHTQTRADEKFVKELDRNLSVSYNTLKFLRSEEIRLEKIYDDCVPYLSRKDARLATRQMKRRQVPWDVRDHRYNEHEEGLTIFCVYVHNTIVNWLCTHPGMRAPKINILLPDSDSKKRMSVYEEIVRRKARELVPHMGCRLRNLGTTVVISQRDDAQEAKGIRLIIEALVGGKFADLIDPAYIVEAMSGWPGEARTFCREMHEFLNPTSPEQSEGSSEDEDHSARHSGESSSTSERAADGEYREGDSADALKELETWGQWSKPTVMGHNQFMDLLFLYNTFIDDLPDTLDEFRAKIHKLFPYVIDTKLVAIKDDTIEGEDPLLDLHHRFDRNRTQPTISWDTAYGYGRRGTAHQAGFDSYMTAVVFIRIAHKLLRERITTFESRLASHERKVKRLYDREWISAIGYDPRPLGYSNNDTRRESSPQEECVGRIRFGAKIFDYIYNRIRIAPRKTVYL